MYDSAIEFAIAEAREVKKDPLEAKCRPHTNEERAEMMRRVREALANAAQGAET